MTNDRPLRHEMSLQLPPELKVGSPADFVSVWHTQNSFILDFAVVQDPPHAAKSESDGADALSVNAIVSQRLRIPPEQVFPLVKALQEQGRRWLKETGRDEVPDNWLDR